MTTRSKTGDAPASASPPASPAESPLVSLDAAIFKEVEVELEAKLGRVTLSIADLMNLRAGSVLELDLKINDRIALQLNQSVLAWGEIVAVGDNFGVRVVEVAKVA